MEKSNYTPGPWEVGRGAGWFIRRPEAVGRREVAMAVGMTPAITLVTNPDTWFVDAEAKANAYLMAAAPETWEMLNEVVNGGYLDGSPEQKRRVVDFLICKAAGK